MKLQKLPQDFTICKIASVRDVDLSPAFCWVGKTDGELSLVCPTADVPLETLAREDGWRAFRIGGTLDLSLVGILAPIARVLAEHEIGIFAVSTYDTDYILVRREQFDRALSLLAAAGYATE